MSKLEQDTQLTLISETDGSNFRASLHPDWQVWYPNGGYMAAILLRAAGEVSAFERPLSISCHFLSVPKIGEVDIKVLILRRTRFAESLRVQLVQDEKLIMEALIWTGTDVDGYHHDDHVMPDVPVPADLKATIELSSGHAPHPLWNNFEQRPVTGDLHWQQLEPSAAIQRDWIRFPPDSQDDNAYIAYGQYIVILDTYCWPAAARAHVNDSRFISPTLSLNVEFLKPHDGGWMLSDASAPLADSGYITAYNHLWSEQGNILATSTATLMCRPRPAG